VAQDFNALQYVAQKVRRNRAVLLCGVLQDGRALQYAAGKLPRDRELVTLAVTNNGLALQVVGVGVGGVGGGGVGGKIPLWSCVPSCIFPLGPGCTPFTYAPPPAPLTFLPSENPSA
jgi:hypothetical protein